MTESEQAAWLAAIAETTGSVGLVSLRRIDSHWLQDAYGAVAIDQLLAAARAAIERTGARPFRHGYRDFGLISSLPADELAVSLHAELHRPVPVVLDDLVVVVVAPWRLAVLAPSPGRSVEATLLALDRAVAAAPAAGGARVTGW